MIAVDGKTLRGARLGNGRQVHLLSALDTTTGIVIAQVTVDTKSNEITSFAPLLDAVEAVLGTLAGVLFTADALHTQTGHADEVTARHAHLLVQVKGNQPTLFKQLKQLPWAQIPAGSRTREHGHGRRETRTITAVTLTTPGDISFRTHSRPPGSPGRVSSQAEPAAKRPTRPCHYPPGRPCRSICRPGSAGTGTWKTASITGVT